MPTLYQLTIGGNQEFVPPRVHLRIFLDHVAMKKPSLLDPKRHQDLMLEFARFAGIKPDRWGMSIASIAWLLGRSPDIERACRNYRADAF